MRLNMRILTALVVSSVALCLLAVWLGHIAAASLNQLKGA